MTDLVSTIDINTIIITIVSSFLTLLGAWIKKEYNKKNRTTTIRQVVEDCVKYVEQKSKTTQIENKYTLAKDKAQNILKSKKINITDDEIDLLIEAFVNCINKEKDSLEEALKNCLK